MPSPSLDQSLQELPPLGQHRPLGQTVQPLQPPPALGPQVQLQPLPPLGSVDSPLVQMEAIAPHLPESKVSPDANYPGNEPDGESPDASPEASLTLKAPTSPSTDAKPSLQRQPVEPAEAPSLPSTEDTASPSPATPSPPESISPTDESISPQTPSDDSTGIAKGDDLSPLPKPPSDAESSPTTQPSLQFKEEPSASPDQGGFGGEQVEEESDRPDPTIPAKRIPEPDASTPSTDSKTVQLSPDTSPQPSTTAQEVPAPTPDVSDTEASSDAESIAATEPTAEARSAETRSDPEPAAVQPQPSTSGQPEISLKPGESLTQANSPPQPESDTSFTENGETTTADLSEPEAIAPSNPTPEKALSAATKAPQIQQQPNSQLEPVTQSLDTSDPTAISHETFDDGAIAPDASPTLTEASPAESPEATAPSSPQIQRQIDKQSANQLPSQPLGQTKPLIQRKDLFLSRYQTEFDQSDTFAETPPEPSDPLKPNPVTPDPNEPIHLLTLPGDTPIPDSWTNLSELVITNEANPPDQRLDSPRSITQETQLEDSAPSEVDNGGSGGDDTSTPHPTTFAPKTPSSTTLTSNSPAANPAEPAAAAIPVAWSSLNELINEHSIESPAIESPKQNIQQISSPQSSIVQPEIQQPSPAESIEINDATMELLTRQVYQGVRSRLILEQEKHWGRSTHPLPWFAIPGSPSLKYLERASIPESSSVQNLSTINSLDLLNEEIYQLLRQRLEVERERQGKGAIAHV
ncbi:MAG: hypothetical protein ACFB8W_10915 [Elainellaceae cyanobacterium]